MKKYAFMLQETDSFGGIKPIQPHKGRKLCFVLGCVVGIIALFCIGFLVGYFVNRQKNEFCSREAKDGVQLKDFENFHEMFKESISTAKLESLMR